MEAALKLKEVCGIQAEPISAAELRHGPIALVQPRFNVLVLAPRGAEQRSVLALADEPRQRGARVIVAAPEGTAGAQLTTPRARSADLDPVVLVQAFYPMVEALARARGLDPDRPPNLSKVTLTL